MEIRVHCMSLDFCLFSRDPKRIFNLKDMQWWSRLPFAFVLLSFLSKQPYTAFESA